jgi:hypothetical protein
MSDLLTVSLPPTLDVPATHAVLASLPKSLRAVSRDGDLTAIDLADEDWPQRLLEATKWGVRGVLLVNPRRMPAALADFEAELTTAPPTVVYSPWALDPTVLAHREQIAHAAASAALVDLLSVVPAGARTLDDVMLDQLALARVTVGEVPIHRSVVFSDFGTSSTRLSVRAPGEEWRLVFADPAYARPTLAYRIDDAGEQLQPTLYETAHRVAWRELHAAVTTGARPAYGMPELAADLELLDGAT